ncbi:hypothetical protein LAJ19_01730 [Deinococcus taeanensis]|uniref:hypothetical protein n=1 Tax=Deinococcus taeanensis TaxID=2737050 RepID=UPI001CDC8FD7|nr:hypothetical protein [Deinococcus taeanensis]UBV42970.1 hypothetical protein LAJ19_01730 [Deinococcus taeanensis]
MTGPKKGSRGRAPKRNTAQGRGGDTRDTSKPARERTPRSDTSSSSGGRSEQRPSGPRRSGNATGPARSAANPARRNATDGGGERSGPQGRGEGTFKPGPGRRAPPRVKKALPELKRVQLPPLAPDMVFVDRDGEKLTFPESNLKRVAAQVLTDKRKAWRYRPFPFPLFTDRGGEQSFHFDFYIYDAEDSVIRLILVVPFESREVWDRVGRFKRQYPMYTYELWTPEKLYRLSGPRGRLEF